LTLYEVAWLYKQGHRSFMGELPKVPRQAPARRPRTLEEIERDLSSRTTPKPHKYHVHTGAVVGKFDDRHRALQYYVSERKRLKDFSHDPAKFIVRMFCDGVEFYSEVGLSPRTIAGTPKASRHKDHAVRRVLVCGGRDFSNLLFVAAVMSGIDSDYGISAIIHGAARGADVLVGQWARAHGIPVEEFPADWKRYGRGAGVRRNEQMLREGKPDLVVAFPGGKGTADMVRRADSAGIRVLAALELRGDLE
jgi:YspA, cpYpsA-related SLOG family